MHISRNKSLRLLAPTLTISRTNIELVSQFKYLGTTVNNSNNYTLTRLATVPLMNAASAHMYRGLMSNLAQPPIKLGIELFGTFITSVASTGHVVHSPWFSPEDRLLKPDQINQVFTRCLKRLLGVRRTTPDCGVYYLTGTLPLSLQIAQLSMQFFIKLANSSTDELEVCALKQMLSNRKLRGTVYKRFIQPVFDLHEFDSVETAMSKIANFNPSVFLTAAKSAFNAALRDRLDLSSKLDLVRLTAPPATMPTWLSDSLIFPVKLTHTLVRVLLSSHNLLIETGRWSTPAGRIPRTDRKCRLCLLGVEEIPHFLTDCPEFEGL